MTSNPFTDPAIAAELTMRERTALMTGADWDHLIDRALAVPIGAPSAAEIDAAAEGARLASERGLAGEADRG